LLASEHFVCASPCGPKESPALTADGVLLVGTPFPFGQPESHFTLQN
jgi:hypothetical protein